ncbi:MAG TPA: hypothetical protein PKO06_21850, partial [Candidatus Ozemobacteraceae bacterium]|nr:hypothetical protein [Candidatus Ozemobacteraceae bacterium]
ASRLHGVSNHVRRAWLALAAKFRADPLTILLDLAIGITLLVLVFLASSSFFSRPPDLSSLAKEWGFRTPGAVMAAQQLVEHSRHAPFPFPYERAYRALENPSQIATDAGEGGLLFLFWINTQQQTAIEDRKAAAVLFLSRLTLHPELPTCGFAVLNSIKEHWSSETIQSLRPHFRSFFLALHQTLSRSDSADKLHQFEALTNPNGDWQMIRPPDTPSPSNPALEADSPEPASSSPETTERFE